MSPLHASLITISKSLRSHSLSPLFYSFTFSPLLCGNLKETSLNAISYKNNRLYSADNNNPNNHKKCNSKEKKDGYRTRTKTSYQVNIFSYKEKTFARDDKDNKMSRARGVQGSNKLGEKMGDTFSRGKNNNSVEGSLPEADIHSTDKPRSFNKDKHLRPRESPNSKPLNKDAQSRKHRSWINVKSRDSENGDTKWKGVSTSLNERSPSRSSSNSWKEVNSNYRLSKSTGSNDDKSRGRAGVIWSKSGGVNDKKLSPGNELKRAERIKSLPKYGDVNRTRGNQGFGIQGGKGMLTSITRSSTDRWIPPRPSSSFETPKPKNHEKSKRPSPHVFDPNRKPKLRWTEEEDNFLLQLVKTNGEDWKKLSEILGRPYNTISYRYTWITSRVWTPEETIRLHEALKEFGEKDEESWQKIKERFPDRTLAELKHNYKQYGSLNPKSDKPVMNVGVWTDEELKRFEEALDKYAGEWKEYELAEYEELWKKISHEVKTRSGRQCRRKYYWQYSRPYDFDIRIKYENI
ncbi:9093_t:CDS:1 [Acaulospora morrowiae]|uniref:9093_t:CDS:1 n=1 Tax=Acaulospora morrowiae TaxID=94023 RepID=A0A9N9FF14_9GLOM|nr:9093_t:CDS:1 [Acaulospora morrowiae]